MKVRPGYYSEQNRNEVYKELLNDASYLKGSCLQVFEAMQDGKMTIHQIAAKIDMPVHLVCARLNDLREDGLVIDTEEKIANPDTGRPNSLWDIDGTKLQAQTTLMFK